MKISVIDIGTQSLKHSIFEVDGTHKELIHYKRYSDANLGENSEISQESIARTLSILNECIKTNKKESVEKTKLLGTDILRKSEKASEFISEVRERFAFEIEILSHEQEAEYLFKGFIPLIDSNTKFSAANIGGGSIEIVSGNGNTLVESEKIPFGVKFLRQTFSSENGMDWGRFVEQLVNEIHITNKAPLCFVTGAYDFISIVGPKLGYEFEECEIINHPIQLNIQQYESFVEKLRTTPVETLKELYPKDPGFCDGVAIGQSTYLAIVQKVEAQTVIPSGNDLTDGVIYELLKEI